MTINKCLEYIKSCGLWVDIIINDQGGITIEPLTPPNKAGGTSSVLSPVGVSGTDLLHTLNVTVSRLKDFYRETGGNHDARKRRNNSSR